MISEESVLNERAEDDNYFLHLTSSPVRFEPVSKVTHVFYDESNRQVFAVRSSGATGVVVNGPSAGTSFSFRIEDKGAIISIKFSPDLKVLAVQRSISSVEFVNFVDSEPEHTEYSQICKGKTTKIQGFVWSRINEIVFVTDHGLEVYQVLPDKSILKLLKTFAFQVNWFVHLMNEGLLLLLSLGSLGNQMQPFHFKAGNIFKLPKFEVDIPSFVSRSSNSKTSLVDRDVILASLYGRNYVAVVRHSQKGIGISGADIVLYVLNKDCPSRKTFVLKLDMSGRFAMTVVDNLLIIHNQASKSSVVFDAGLSGESDGYVTYHSPVTTSLSIKPFRLRVPVVPTRVSQEPVVVVSCETYSPHWVVFQPNIIIDAKMGCLWQLQLKMDNIISMIADKCRLVDFLLLRDCTSKPVLLRVCRELLLQTPRPPLPLLSSIFDRLIVVYKRCSDLESNSQLALPTSSTLAAFPGSTVCIDQSDMYTDAFMVLSEKGDEQTCDFLVTVVMEYIRSLNQMHIPVQHFLYELVINTLVQHNKFYRLHQLLQYQVLSDSKPLVLNAFLVANASMNYFGGLLMVKRALLVLACLMLSLEGIYAPSHQLALDMLKRICTANEEIIEVLLSKQMLIPTLRFIRSTGGIDNISARKFLEAALNTGDTITFYSVYKFFEQRNMRLRGSPNFAKGEHCEPYVRKFEELMSLNFNEKQATPTTLIG